MNAYQVIFEIRKGMNECQANMIAMKILRCLQMNFQSFQKKKKKKKRKKRKMENILKKLQVGNDQEMAQSERNSHSINREVGKN